ncbi:MAG: hypothetical protein QNK19_01245, partial [Xanthomonadales bacterium]|nr:hypothetical protein [Xanthomonadales bacterium]
TIRRKQSTVTPIHEEESASVDKPFKTVAKEEPEIVTEAPEIVTKLPNIVPLESVCKPFNQKMSANTY